MNTLREFVRRDTQRIVEVARLYSWDDVETMYAWLQFREKHPIVSWLLDQWFAFYVITNPWMWHR